MRWIGFGLLFGLLGCGGVEMAEEERIARCLGHFRDYDRALAFGGGESEIVRRVIGNTDTRPLAREIAEAGLKRLECYSEPGDLSAAAAGSARFAGDGIGTLARPEYLHAGLYRGRGEANRVSAYFKELGYRVRNVGAPGLGRRIFVGPLESVEARRGAEALARAAGLKTSYTVERLPWP